MEHVGYNVHRMPPGRTTSPGAFGLSGSLAVSAYSHGSVVHPLRTAPPTDVFFQGLPQDIDKLAEQPNPFDAKFEEPSFWPWLYRAAKWGAQSLFSRAVGMEVTMTEADLQKLKTIQNLDGGVMMTPNHSDYYDAVTLAHLLDKMDLPQGFQFLTTHEVMQGPRPLFKRIGGFSFNPSAPEIAATRHAIKTMQDKDIPLVIFPEGRITSNYRGTQYLEEGVSFVALSACKPEKSQGSGEAESLRPMYVVPTAFHYTYAPPESTLLKRMIPRLFPQSLEEGVQQQLKRIEKKLKLPIRPDDSYEERCTRILKAMIPEVYCPEDYDTLEALVDFSRHAMLEELSQEYLGHGASESINARRQTYFIEHAIRKMALSPELPTLAKQYFKHKRMLDLLRYTLYEDPQRLIPEGNTSHSMSTHEALNFICAINRTLFSKSVPVPFLLFNKKVEIRLGDPIAVHQWVEQQRESGNEKRLSKYKNELTERIQQELDRLLQRPPLTLEKERG